MEIILFIVIFYFVYNAITKSNSSSPSSSNSSSTPNREPTIIPDIYLSSYQKLLEEYYQTYKDQVFQQRTLSEIQKNLAFERDLSEIKHDLKIVRRELGYSPSKSQTEPSKKHRDFYSYVTSMSDTQLINTINGQYKAIKGTWNVAPCMGEFGSIEFAAVLLLWRYAVGNFDRNRKSYASLQITLGDIICCSFFGMPAGEWSDKKDPILNAHGDILTLEEFGDVYNYLKDNIIHEIHQMEFNNGNAKPEVYRQLYTKFTQIYNSANDFLDMLDYYTEKGLKIKDSMSFSNSNQDARKALLLQNWESGWEEFIEDVDVDMPPTLTDKFYISSYRCPNCGKHMYKAVFPIGKEFPINIGNGKLISMKRIFTCSTCQTFYTPLPEHKLSYGQCYFLKLAKTAEYRLLLETYDSHSTTTGRPDA